MSSGYEDDDPSAWFLDTTDPGDPMDDAPWWAQVLGAVGCLAVGAVILAMAVRLFRLAWPF
jgi:hypothetical protein